MCLKKKNSNTHTHTDNATLCHIKEGRQRAEQERISWLKFIVWRKTWIKMYLHNIELLKCHVSTLDEQHTCALFSFLFFKYDFSIASAEMILKMGGKTCEYATNYEEREHFFFFILLSLSLSLFMGIKWMVAAIIVYHRCGLFKMYHIFSATI